MHLQAKKPWLSRGDEVTITMALVKQNRREGARRPVPRTSAPCGHCSGVWAVFFRFNIKGLGILCEIVVGETFALFIIGP